MIAPSKAGTERVSISFISFCLFRPISGISASSVVEILRPSVQSGVLLCCSARCPQRSLFGPYVLGTADTTASLP